MNDLKHCGKTLECTFIIDIFILFKVEIKKKVVEWMVENDMKSGEGKVTIWRQYIPNPILLMYLCTWVFLYEISIGSFPDIK